MWLPPAWKNIYDLALSTGCCLANAETVVFQEKKKTPPEPAQLADIVDRGRIVYTRWAWQLSMACLAKDWITCLSNKTGNCCTDCAGCNQHGHEDGDSGKCLCRGDDNFCFWKPRCETSEVPVIVIATTTWILKEAEVWRHKLGPQCPFCNPSSFPISSQIPQV